MLTNLRRINTNYQDLLARPNFFSTRQIAEDTAGRYFEGELKELIMKAQSANEREPGDAANQVDFGPLISVICTEMQWAVKWTIGVFSHTANAKAKLFSKLLRTMI